MAVQLNATYSKKLGLPQYSSHSFSVSVQTEVTDLTNVPGECERLYSRLQESVDQEIQKTGWLPNSSSPSPANNGSHTSPNTNPGPWNCSEKQRNLILDIVEQNSLDRHQIDGLARERFGKGVRELNKLEASGLIDELLEKHGGRRNGRRNSANRQNRSYRTTRSSPVPEGRRS